MHWSKSTRWLLRMSLGLTIATEAEFSLQRERVHNTIPKLYLCSDEHSVTSNVDDTVEWMLTLEHIVAMLRRVTILTTIIGNDGALPLPVPLALPTLCVAISIFCNQPHVTMVYHPPEKGPIHIHVIFGQNGAGARRVFLSNQQLRRISLLHLRTRNVRTNLPPPCLHAMSTRTCRTRGSKQAEASMPGRTVDQVIAACPRPLTC